MSGNKAKFFGLLLGFLETSIKKRRKKKRGQNNPEEKRRKKKRGQNNPEEKELLSFTAGRNERPKYTDEEIELQNSINTQQTVETKYENVRYVSEFLKDYSDVCRNANLYSWNLVTIALFYGLPVVQLVFLNQKLIFATGNEDICFYNFMCAHHFWIFIDFNHIFSNIGYIILGSLFLLIVRHKKSRDVKVEDLKNMQISGIPRHYGLFYAMGWALFVEGILSASYHVCPNASNFQFDTAFMYVISTVCMLKLFHGRHPNICATSHRIWILLAMLLIIVLLGILTSGIYGGEVLFKCLFIPFRYACTLAAATTMHQYEDWDMNWQLPCQIFMAWKEVFKRKKSKVDKCQIGMFLFTILSNIAIDILGYSVQFEVPTYLLFLFIGNLAIYVAYYTSMKIYYERHWKLLIYILLVGVCWASAMYFFVSNRSTWTDTPAISREKNEHCDVDFFDNHDIWHILSSVALFATYMYLFTMDDNLKDKPISEIVVF